LRNASTSDRAEADAGSPRRAAGAGVVSERSFAIALVGLLSL
jgi:hypothetical protein